MTSDPRPLRGYAVLLSGYVAAGTGLTFVLRRRQTPVEQLTWRELALYGLAVEHLSRLVTKDSVTGVLRSPFTSFKEPAGEGEVNEEVTGDGLRHAIGELLTCPFCAAQWISTALIAGRSLVPRFTGGVVAICAVARVSDHLQLAYGLLKNQQ